MFLWVKKSRRDGLIVFAAGGWRFDEYRRDPTTVSRFSWSAVPRGTLVMLTAVRRVTYREVEPGIFEAKYAGRDSQGRPRFSSTVENATRLANPLASFAMAADGRAAEELRQWVRRKRASQALVRRIIHLDGGAI